MLKLPKRGGNGASQGEGEGTGRKKRKLTVDWQTSIYSPKPHQSGAPFASVRRFAKEQCYRAGVFFLPLPLPPLLFLPSHLPSGLILLLSPIFLCHRIKDGGFIVAIRLTSFRSPKIRLHCRLRRFVEEFCQLCEEKMEKVERKRKTDRDLYEVEVVEAGYDAKKQLKIHFVWFSHEYGRNDLIPTITMSGVITIMKGITFSSFAWKKCLPRGRFAGG